MRRTIALIAIVAAFVIGSKLLIENVLGFSFEPWARSWMADAGSSGAAVVIGLLAVDIFIPVPSSMVMILSGAAFGVWWGSVLAFAGSIGGEWLGFELARRYGTALSTRFIGDETEAAPVERRAGDARRRRGRGDAGAAGRDGDDEHRRRTVDDAAAARS